ncbi:50S ribosomal protein L25/general stress protein Ctc [Virgibacillus sp. 179-BFC.A HS]|uniref:Large ribosomal subunit protein bL25 n=1 Tax=Tigheibacillus jepli TaxID=3035914 RepID=A0ABU5CCI7_9BACI|nr:50S ribosomal protein L25/general stress protein Ctc [Virgibacillus sp. 179-BFC.A HS]MDY0404043.1 50S ribosomal protein L25/general stress protein Ctc [Virgibacillus sp. 179-BFC.A HS]
MATTLKAVKRQDHKSSTTKKLRWNGQVPGIVYGKNKENTSIALDSVALVKAVRDNGRNAIFQLAIDSEKPVQVMVHDSQMEPIKDELLHVDFYIVDMKEEMDVEVALNLTGEAPGAKTGGVLQQPLYELQVRAKPGDIPEEIAVDVSQLEIGDSIAVGDLPKSDKYEILDDPDTTVATVLAPDTLEDVEEAPSENDEPELVDAESKDK